MFDIDKLNVNDELWDIINDNENYYGNELKKELNKLHVLYGIQLKALARRLDRDDVLFLLLEGTERYAVVHLSWIGKEEKEPQYPLTRLYNNFNDLINKESY